MIEFNLLFTKGAEITELKLDNSLSTPIAGDWKQRKEQAMVEVERAFLKASLQQHQGNIKEIAAHMGLSTRAVYNKLKKYKINPDEYRI